MDADERQAVPYHDGHVAATLARPPFNAFCKLDPAVDGTRSNAAARANGPCAGKPLIRGRYNGLCATEESLRQHPEALEHFSLAPLACGSSTTSHSAVVVNAFSVSPCFLDGEADEQTTGSSSPQTVLDEREQRRREKDRAASSSSPLPRTGTVVLQVEPFSRSAAGKVLDPDYLRTPLALEKSMHFLVQFYLRTPHTPLCFTEPFKVWGYLWDRLRGIRTTWVPQLPLCSAGFCNYTDESTGAALSPMVLQQESRRRMQWLEFTVAALSVGACYLCRTVEGCRRFVQEKKNFLESISQCFTDLTVWYRSEQRSRHAEFVSLLLLLYGLNQESKAEDRAAFCSFAKSALSDGSTRTVPEPAKASVNLTQAYKELEKQPHLIRAQPVKAAVRLMDAWASGHWFEFFHLCQHERLTPLQRTFLFQSFTYARFRCVLDLVLPTNPVYPKLRRRNDIALQTLSDLLMMQSVQHCVQFLACMGLEELIDESRGVLRLSTAGSAPLVSVELIEERCSNKGNLLFPTHAAFFDFRVWREAFERFPQEQGFCTGGQDLVQQLRALTSQQRRRATLQAAGAGGTDAAAAAEAEERQLRELEGRMLELPGCPVNLMEILEVYCPVYNADVAQMTMRDVPGESYVFGSLQRHREAMLIRCLGRRSPSWYLSPSFPAPSGHTGTRDSAAAAVNEVLDVFESESVATDSDLFATDDGAQEWAERGFLDENDGLHGGEEEEVGPAGSNGAVGEMGKEDSTGEGSEVDDGAKDGTPASLAESRAFIDRLREDGHYARVQREIEEAAVQREAEAGAARKEKEAYLRSLKDRLQQQQQQKSLLAQEDVMPTTEEKQEAERAPARNAAAGPGEAAELVGRQPLALPAVGSVTVTQLPNDYQHSSASSPPTPAVTTRATVETPHSTLLPFSPTSGAATDASPTGTTASACAIEDVFPSMPLPPSRAGADSSFTFPKNISAAAAAAAVGGTPAENDGSSAAKDTLAATSVVTTRSPPAGDKVAVDGGAATHAVPEQTAAASEKPFAAMSALAKPTFLSSASSALLSAQGRAARPPDSEGRATAEASSTCRVPSAAPPPSDPCGSRAGTHASTTETDDAAAAAAAAAATAGPTAAAAAPDLEFSHLRGSASTSPAAPERCTAQTVLQEDNAPAVCARSGAVGGPARRPTRPRATATGPPVWTVSHADAAALAMFASAFTDLVADYLSAVAQQLFSRQRSREALRYAVLCSDMGSAAAVSRWRRALLLPRQQRSADAETSVSRLPRSNSSSSFFAERTTGQGTQPHTGSGGARSMIAEDALAQCMCVGFSILSPSHCLSATESLPARKRPRAQEQLWALGGSVPCSDVLALLSGEAADVAPALQEASALSVQYLGDRHIPQTLLRAPDRLVKTLGTLGHELSQQQQQLPVKSDHCASPRGGHGLSARLDSAAGASVALRSCLMLVSTQTSSAGMRAQQQQQQRIAELFADPFERAVATALAGGRTHTASSCGAPPVMLLSSPCVTLALGTSRRAVAYGEEAEGRSTAASGAAAFVRVVDALALVSVHAVSAEAVASAAAERVPAQRRACAGAASAATAEGREGRNSAHAGHRAPADLCPHVTPIVCLALADEPACDPPARTTDAAAAAAASASSASSEDLFFHASRRDKAMAALRHVTQLCASAHVQRQAERAASSSDDGARAADDELAASVPGVVVLALVPAALTATAAIRRALHRVHQQVNASVQSCWLECLAAHGQRSEPSPHHSPVADAARLAWRTSGPRTGGVSSAKWSRRSLTGALVRQVPSRPACAAAASRTVRPAAVDARHCPLHVVIAPVFAPPLTGVHDTDQAALLRSVPAALMSATHAILKRYQSRVEAAVGGGNNDHAMLARRGAAALPDVVLHLPAALAHLSAAPLAPIVATTNAAPAALVTSPTDDDLFSPVTFRRSSDDNSPTYQPGTAFC